MIVEQTQRMTRIIDEILSFARMQPAKITRLDLGGVLRKAIVLSEHTSRKHKTSILLDVPKTAIEIDGDADKLLQIIVNLVVNGVQAMPGGGTLNVSMRDEHCAPVDDPGWRGAALRVHRRGRPWRRHSRAPALEGVRSVLLDQECRRRHGARPVGRSRHCAGA